MAKAFRKGTYSQRPAVRMTTRTLEPISAADYNLGYTMGYAHAQSIYQKQLQNIEYLYRKEMGRKKK